MSQAPMFTGAGWSVAAHDYGHTTGRMTAPFCHAAATIVADALAKTPTDDQRSVLDVATGTGEVVMSLQEQLTCRGASAVVTATDVSRGMIKALDEQLTKLSLKPADENCDATAVPTQRACVTVKTLVQDAATLSDISDGSVDALVCAFGLMFVPDVDAATAAAFRVLKRGGTAVFTTWHYLSTSDVFHKVAVDQHRTAKPQAAGRFNDEGFLRRLFAAAGFDVQSVSFPQSVSLMTVDAMVDLFTTNPVFTGYGDWDLEVMRGSIRTFADGTGAIPIRGTAITTVVRKP